MDVSESYEKCVISDVYYQLLKYRVGDITEFGTKVTKGMRKVIEDRFIQIAGNNTIKKHKIRKGNYGIPRR